MIRTPQLSPRNQIPTNSIPLPVINIQSMPNKPLMRATAPMHQVIRSTTNSPMSPLSLNVGSPMYSLPSSPNSYSPGMSPAHRERVMSPYTPQSLSPVGKFHQVYSPGRLLSPVGVIQGCDPYLNNKMQASPGFPLQTSDILLDSSMPLNSSDFWNETDMMQTSDLLTAFDDVKLA